LDRLFTWESSESGGALSMERTRQDGGAEESHSVGVLNLDG
jgi:hypothetical protein